MFLIVLVLILIVCILIIDLLGGFHNTDFDVVINGMFVVICTFDKNS